MTRRLLARAALAAAVFVSTTQAGAAASVPFVIQPYLELLPAPHVQALPPVPPIFATQLILDDDNAEAKFGVSQGQFSKQFLWFNRFASPGDFRLQQIWVLFPVGDAVAGDAIQLVVYHDPDSNPTNGATLLLAQAATVQIADGNTFSIYTVAPDLQVPSGGDVLIGVIDRWVVSGTTLPIVAPASEDTTATQNRSWIAVWTGDPPATPTLPSDNINATVDTVSTGGNWMIRGFGLPVPIVQIPTLSPLPLGALAAALLLAGLFWLRRRNAAASPS